MCRKWYRLQLSLTSTQIADEYIIPIYYSVNIQNSALTRNIMTIKKENKIMVIIAPTADD